MDYLFTKGTFNKDGTWTMPAWAVERWVRQAETSYPNLSEVEKDSDRTEADKFISAISGSVGDLSDGCHTFNELYDHRYALFFNVVLAKQRVAFKTRKDHLGKELDGWFILGINTVSGQITYCIPVKYWDKVQVKEVERNLDYDGHSASDVLERLLSMI